MYLFEDEEYKSRNFILSLEHGKIPSYCLWQSSNNTESIQDKIIWWEKFLSSKYILVKMISKYWIRFLHQYMS